MALDRPLPDGKLPAMYGELLKKLRIQHEFTLEQVAERVGISVSQAHRYETEEREPKFHEIAKFAEIYNIPVGLLFGDTAPASKITSMPRLSWVSAGALRSHVPIIDMEEWPTIEASGLPEGDWIALEVEGDSMDRISPPGSLIFVNRRDRRLVPNGCYVIADEQGQATYKRYRPNPDRFEPVSVNPIHEPVYPDNEPIIIGRVKRSIIDM